MASDVIGGHCRAGQYELSGAATPIHLAPDMVPDGRLDLPLVDESRPVSGQHQCGIDGHGLASVLVDVEQHLAGRALPGGFRFAAGSWTLDQHGPGGTQPFFQLLVRDSPYVHSVPVAPDMAMRATRYLQLI